MTNVSDGFNRRTDVSTACWWINTADWHVARVGVAFAGVPSGWERDLRFAMHQGHAEDERDYSDAQVHCDKWQVESRWWRGVFASNDDKRLKNICNRWAFIPFYSCVFDFLEIFLFVYTTDEKKCISQVGVGDTNITQEINLKK